MKLWGHFKTITKHKLVVMQHCFRIGLYKQGLAHDMSKYMPSEFWVGVHYYQGTRSPNNAEREVKGYSAAWMHHKGRNKHHYEYWTDYSATHGVGVIPIAMPSKYVLEMFCDRVAACKVYQGKEYTDSSPLKYYENGRARHLMHPLTAKQLEWLLTKLANEGEDSVFAFLKVHKRDWTQYCNENEK